MTSDDEAPLSPRVLRVASDWSWRLLVIGAVVALLVWAAAYMSLVVVPVIIALMATALLEPVRRLLMRAGLSHGWASTLTFLLGVAFIASVLTLAITQVVSNFDKLSDQTTDGLAELARLLRMRPGTFTGGFDKWIDRLRADPENAISGTFTILSTTGGLLAGALLTIVATLFLMRDRHRMGEWVLAWLPDDSRHRGHHAISASWNVLVRYMQVTLTSAVVDSLLIGGAAAIAGLPVSFALGVIVFLSAFIPTVGAIVSGALVVLVALVAKNVTTAIVLAIVVVVVQQLDANVMYPLLASKRLSIHPLAALLLVAAGGIIGGIVGAFIAVPTATVLGAIVTSTRQTSLTVGLAHPDDPTR